MKTLALLTAPFLALSPLSAQEGPREATDMMDLFERMHRQGASEDDLRKFLDENVRRELMMPEGGEGTLKFAPVEERPRIGVLVRPVDDVLRGHLQLPEDAAVLVDEVMKGSSAERAGLRKNDIIVSADGTGVKDLLQLSRAVVEAGKERGEISLEIIQDGTRKTVSVTVDMPKPPAPPEKKDAEEKEAGRPKKDKQAGRPAPGIEWLQRRLDDQQRQIQQLRREIERMKRDRNGPEGDDGE